VEASFTSTVDFDDIFHSAKAKAFHQAIFLAVPRSGGIRSGALPVEVLLGHMSGLAMTSSGSRYFRKPVVDGPFDRTSGQKRGLSWRDQWIELPVQRKKSKGTGYVTGVHFDGNLHLNTFLLKHSWRGCVIGRYSDSLNS